jgi:MinD-like ATPase involved in chromosome partitioning or flagellar assembly
MNFNSKLGQIITFYSYKGGVGRTMALANIAVLLAQRGKRVLMIDWDLEAPGLERYFEPYIDANDRKNEGLIEFLLDSLKLPKMLVEEEDETKLLAQFETVTKYIFSVRKNKKWNGDLFLLRAGDIDNQKKSYSGKILSFKWTDFFNKIPSFFPFFAYYLKEHFDFILIDSRTGHTDAGGVCTMLLPDSLVVAFTPNQQNLEGVLALCEKASSYRKNSPDLRPLTIYPLPSRIEINEKEEREMWVRKYTIAFEQTLQNIYNLPPISLSRYFDTPIVQSTYYAFGEKIAVLDETVKDSLSLSNAYSTFIGKILSKQKIWDFLGLEYRQKSTPKLKVVLIYSNADELMAAELGKHLNQIKNLETEWESIVVSSELSNFRDYGHIKTQIDNANVLIFLISADFFSSDITTLMLKQSEKFSKEQKFGIILKPCLWDIFLSSGEYTIFPNGDKSISEYPNLDIYYKAVTLLINDTIDLIHHKK